MTAAATASPSTTVASAASTTWRDACVLAIALVALVWVSDVQGVVGHRDEFQTTSQWLLPGFSYLFAAGIALWQWDWVARVFTSWRFGLVALATAAAIASASTRREARVETGVPVLRAGERDRLPTVAHVLPPASAVSWMLPATHHSDILAAAEPQDAPESQFDYDLPAGWTALATSSNRLINLRVAGDARSECYLASLAGSAGGTLDNVNRWRGQMGLPAIDAAALAQLPRGKLLGREAVIVELDGAFTGQVGGTLADARMLGAIASLPAVTLFLKMTGPREVVQAQRAGFDKLLASIRLRGQDAPKATAPKDPRDPAAPGSTPPVKSEPAKTEPGKPAGAAVGEGLRWTVPDGWQAGPARSMRAGTLNPKGMPDVECYVTILAGDAGGVLPNVNRWRDQFAAAPLKQADLDALPKVKAFGKEVPVIDATGTFTGMGGGPREGYALLGVVVPLDDCVVFVKMTGPQAQVQGERERFLAFSRSLGRE